jgi:hypothetical protein
MEQFPRFNFSHFVDDLLKEINVAGTTYDETFSSEHYHLSEIFFYYLFHFELTSIICINTKSLPLSIKTVNLISSVAVETFVWKVLDVTFYNMAADLSDDFSFSNINNDVVVGTRIVVKNVHEDFIFVDKAAGAEWFWKHLITHSVIIET